MAAVTVSRYRNNVAGNRRMISARVIVANTGDTWTVNAVHVIDSVQTTPATAIAAGVTTSGNVITFLSAASNPTQVTVIGY